MGKFRLYFLGVPIMPYRIEDHKGAVVIFMDDNGQETVYFEDKAYAERVVGRLKGTYKVQRVQDIKKRAHESMVHKSSDYLLDIVDTIKLKMVTHLDSKSSNRVSKKLATFHGWDGTTEPPSELQIASYTLKASREIILLADITPSGEWINLRVSPS